MNSAGFPPEIWQLIINSLCLHCSRGQSDSIIPDWTPSSYDFSSSRGALANLCLVSRWMHHLATPALYHLPTTSKPVHLVRTLTSRPDLASLVCELHAAKWSGWPPGRHRDAYPRAFLDLYHQARDAAPHIRGHYSYQGEINYQTRDTIIIALLPSIVRLSIEYRQTDGNACVGLAPGSLPNLTSACITNLDPDSFTHPYQLPDIAAAAPNLTHLHLRMTGSEDYAGFGFIDLPIFPQVTTLTIDTCDVLTKTYTRLVRAFPRLETLLVHGTGPGQFTVGSHANQIQKDLVRYRPGLKRLCVDCSSVDFTRLLKREFDEGLAALRELEYLVADMSCFGARDEKGVLSGIYLGSLPASLRGLSILCWGTGDPDMVGEALLALAEVAPERLPALESVVAVCEEVSPLNGELEAAWTRVGVEFRCDVGDWSKQELGSAWKWP